MIIIYNDEVECPFCKGDGEFIIYDENGEPYDYYICDCCKGLGYLKEEKIKKIL